MSITLPAELEKQLREEAARHGVDPETYATELLAQSLKPAPAQAESLADLFKKWQEEDYTDDPQEIARRTEEFEEFKEAMNRNRLESEGPNARKIYP